MNEPAWWGWEAGARSTRSRPIDHGLVLDYGEDDQLIGITSPVNATFTDDLLDLKAATDLPC